MGKNSNIIGIQLLDLVWWKEWGIHIRLELAGVGKYSHNLIYAKLQTRQDWPAGVHSLINAIKVSNIFTAQVVAWRGLALQDGWEVYFPAITGDPPQPGVKKVDGFYELP